MQAGTIIKVKDGRIGTVVYHGLDGDGIKWGKHNVRIEDFEGTDGNTCIDTAPEGFNLFPDAMLREPYPSASVECVGNDFKIISTPPRA